jgi:hypothetical protein
LGKLKGAPNGPTTVSEVPRLSRWENETVRWWHNCEVSKKWLLELIFKTDHGEALQYGLLLNLGWLMIKYHRLLLPLYERLLVVELMHLKLKMGLGCGPVH